MSTSTASADFYTVEASVCKAVSTLELPSDTDVES